MIPALKLAKALNIKVTFLNYGQNKYFDTDELDSEFYNYLEYAQVSNGDIAEIYNNHSSASSSSTNRKTAIVLATCPSLDFSYLELLRAVLPKAYDDLASIRAKLLEYCHVYTNNAGLIVNSFPSLLSSASGGLIKAPVVLPNGTYLDQGEVFVGEDGYAIFSHVDSGLSDKKLIKSNEIVKDMVSKNVIDTLLRMPVSFFPMHQTAASTDKFTVLDLSGKDLCTELNEKKEVFLQMKNIDKINLSGCKMLNNHQGYLILRDLLRWCYSLDLSNVDFGELVPLDFMFFGITECQNLQEINLSKSNLGKVARLGEVFEYLWSPNLERIDLSYNSLASLDLNILKQMSQSFSGITSLETLILENNGFDKLSKDKLLMIFASIFKSTNAKIRIEQAVFEQIKMYVEDELGTSNKLPQFSLSSSKSQSSGLSIKILSILKGLEYKDGHIVNPIMKDVAIVNNNVSDNKGARERYLI